MIKKDVVSMQIRTWKVGELSKLTGLTIRTLHHYDEIGLLCPSSHTASGHRLYAEEDIVKLQQIMSLKELGLSLEEIKEIFQSPGYNPKDIIELQLEKLEEEIRAKEELKEQLQDLREVFNSWQKPDMDQFIRAIELIRNQSKYFSQDQRIKLKQYYNKLNTEEAKELADKWSTLISCLQAELKNVTPIDNPRVVELAKRWQKGIEFFTGGDAGIVQSAERYYTDNPHAAKGTGMSGELYKYIAEVLANIK
jgi:DNA-binding transcriptional MerR regulator